MVLTGLVANHTVEYLKYPKVLHELEEKTILKAEDVTLAPFLFIFEAGLQIANRYTEKRKQVE